jgi:two-component sensor histidine kinase
VLTETRDRGAGYGEDAGSATYTLDACRYRGVLRLTVSDDGRGIEDGRANKHDDPGFGMGLIEQLADRSTTSARPNGGRRVAMQFDLAR